MSDDADKKPPLSAAQAKKPVGRKPRVHWENGPAPEGERDNTFCCVKCGKTHPLSEVGRTVGGNKRECKACVAKIAAISDGSYRYGNNTLESYQRASRKNAKKTYLSGRLPKWMYS